MSLPFLLEIGSEEIPDWMIVPALAHLRELFEKLLEENRLGGRVEHVDATPRRLILYARDLAERQSNSEELVSGPPKSAGPGAAAGFAKKMGVPLDRLETTITPKGDYLAYRRQIPGRETREILANALPDLIL